jgi:hypothetical protein
VARRMSSTRRRCPFREIATAINGISKAAILIHCLPRFFAGLLTLVRMAKPHSLDLVAMHTRGIRNCRGCPDP